MRAWPKGVAGSTNTEDGWLVCTDSGMPSRGLTSRSPSTRRDPTQLCAQPTSPPGVGCEHARMNAWQIALGCITAVASIAAALLAWRAGSSATDQHESQARRIEDLFGSSVLAMVACSSPKKEDPGMAEFRVRKQIALDHLTVERNVGALRLPWRTRCTMRVAQSTISKQRAWLSATPGAARAPVGRARRRRTRMPCPGDPRQRCRRDPPAAPAVRGS